MKWNCNSGDIYIYTIYIYTIYILYIYYIYTIYILYIYILYIYYIYILYIYTIYIYYICNCFTNTSSTTSHQNICPISETSIFGSTRLTDFLVRQQQQNGPWISWMTNHNQLKLHCWSWLRSHLKVRRYFLWRSPAKDWEIPGSGLFRRKSESAEMPKKWAPEMYCLVFLGILIVVIPLNSSIRIILLPTIYWPSTNVVVLGIVALCNIYACYHSWSSWTACKHGVSVRTWRGPFSGRKGVV